MYLSTKMYQQFKDNLYRNLNLNWQNNCKLSKMIHRVRQWSNHDPHNVTIFLVSNKCQKLNLELRQRCFTRCIIDDDNVTMLLAKFFLLSNALYIKIFVLIKLQWLEGTITFVLKCMDYIKL